MLCVAGSDSLPLLQGTKCDVREGQDVKDLVGFAQRNLKYIDIWVLMLDLLSLLPYLLNVNFIYFFSKLDKNMVLLFMLIENLILMLKVIFLDIYGFY